MQVAAECKIDVGAPEEGDEDRWLSTARPVRKPDTRGELRFAIAVFVIAFFLIEVADKFN